MASMMIAELIGRAGGMAAASGAEWEAEPVRAGDGAHAGKGGGVGGWGVPVCDDGKKFGDAESEDTDDLDGDDELEDEADAEGEDDEFDDDDDLEAEETEIFGDDEEEGADAGGADDDEDEDF